MRINYLELKNYRKFENARLEMPDGVVGIIGSNGVGKSTLVEAIAWALFGNQREIVRESKDSVRRDGIGAGEPTKVKLEFNYANDEYAVTREMSGKALTMDAILEINGKLIARGASEVTSEIEKKLGMDYKSFFISVFARQKDLAALTSLNPADRRATIVRMLGIDRLDEIITNVSAEVRRERERNDDHRGRLFDEKGKPKSDSLKEQKKIFEKQKEENDKIIIALKKGQEGLKKEQDELEEKYKVANERLKKLIEVENSLKIAKMTLDAKKGELGKIEESLVEANQATISAKKLDELRPKLDEMKKKKDQLLAAQKDHERLAELTEDVDSAQTESANLEKELKNLYEVIDKVKNELKGLDQIKEEKIELKKTVDSLKGEISALRENEKTLSRENKENENHLKDMAELGPNSKCPTCERPLGDHFGELKQRLDKTLDDGRVRLKDIQNKIANVDADIIEKDKKLEAIDRKIDWLGKKERELAQAERTKDLKEKESQKIAGKLAKLQSELKKFKEIPFDRNALDEIVENLTELEHEKEKLSSDAAFAKKAPEFEKSKKRISEEISGLESRASSIKFDETEKDLVESSIEEITKKRTELRAQAEQSYEKRMQLIQEKESAVSGLQAVSKELASLSEIEEKLKKTEEELVYVSKLHEIMKSFRENLISRITPTLSQIASELLAQLTEGRYRTLTLDSEYNISIEDGGESHGIERFSGGETDLANLCLRLAISRVIAERTYTEGINLLVLDEIFGSQDASRKRNLLTSFNSLSRQFRQIILITHIDDVRDQLGTMLEVYQDERGVSHVREAT